MVSKKKSVRKLTLITQNVGDVKKFLKSYERWNSHACFFFITIARNEYLLAHYLV